MSEHELWNELGNLYFMSNAYDQAIHAYRRSIQIESGFGRPYSNLALTYAQRGNYEEAIRLFRRGIELLDNDKEKAISWMRLGNVFRRQKDYREAVLAYQHADELDPQSSENRDEPGQGLYTPSEPLVFEQDSVEENSEAEPIDQQDAISASSPDEAEDAAIIEAESSADIPADLNLDEPVAAETSDCEIKESPIDADIEEDSDSGERHQLRALGSHTKPG